MATIPKANIVTGNVILASDVKTIVDALDGTTAYDIIIGASITNTGSGTNLNTTATHIINRSAVTQMQALVFGTSTSLNMVLARDVSSDDLKIKSWNGGANSGTDLVTIATGGNVGIGTTAPGGILDVRGGTASSGHGTGLFLTAQAGAASSNGGNVIINAGANGADGNNGQIIFAAGGAITTTAPGSVTGERVRIDSSGNVGIGTASTNIASGSGKVLTVSGGTTTRGDVEVVTSVADADVVLAGLIRFGSTSNNGVAGAQSIAEIQGYVSGATATNRGGYFSFLTRTNAGSLLERLKIDNLGNSTFSGNVATKGYKSNVVTKTAAYTATVNDEIILVDATAGAVTITLVAASNTGLRLHIEKIDSSVNAVTISRAGTDTIEGATSITLSSQYQSRVLAADGGSIWYRQSSL